MTIEKYDKTSCMAPKNLWIDIRRIVAGTNEWLMQLIFAERNDNRIMLIRWCC